MDRKSKPFMIGKHVTYQNPNTVEDGSDGQIVDKIMSRGTNYYLLRLTDDSVKSVPCHWVCQIKAD